MGNIQIISTYSVLIGLSFGFCTAFLSALWLYRIWKQTKENAYLFLWLGMGILPLVLVASTGAMILNMVQGNPVDALSTSFVYRFCNSIIFIVPGLVPVALLIGLLLLEKDRVPRRQFIPEKIRIKLASNMPGGSPLSLPPAQKIAGIVLLIIAAAVAYSLIRAFDPHTAMWRIIAGFMKSWVAGLLVCFWLFRLYQLTHDKSHLWLLAALLAGPATEILIVFLMKTFGLMRLLAGNSIFYYFIHLNAIRIITLVCTIMALRTMACGAVSFREVFFPGVKEAEDS